MSRTIEVDFLPQAFEEAKEKPRILIIDNTRDFTRAAKLALERTGATPFGKRTNQPNRARRTHPFDPSRRREGVCTPETGVDDPAAGNQTVRRQAEIMETETRRFYERAADKVSDASTRKLLGDLAEAERKHVTLADNLQQEYLTPEVEAQEEKAHRRLFVLQIVQPGLAGLMDGSVSTLAPVFAAAFATHNSHAAFLVGLAASVGAGISMGFAEAAI